MCLFNVHTLYPRQQDSSNQHGSSTWEGSNCLRTVGEVFVTADDEEIPTAEVSVQPAKSSLLSVKYSNVVTLVEW